MDGFAPFTESTFAAVHSRLDREKDAGIDGLLDLSGEVDESLEIVVRPERVELMVSWRFRFDNQIKPE
jgi:hypothetical protein